MIIERKTFEDLGRGTFIAESLTGESVKKAILTFKGNVLAFNPKYAIFEVATKEKRKKKHQ